MFHRLAPAETRAWVNDLMPPIPPSRWLTYSALDAKPAKVAELIRAAGLADGQWHSIEQIAQTISVSPRSVTNLLKGLTVKNGTAPKKNHGLAVKARRGLSEYRIVPLGKLLLARDVVTALTPLLRDLEHQSATHMANWSPATIKMCAGLLGRLLRDWAE